MDNFMDKLAKRFNAGEIIKANSQADGVKSYGQVVDLLLAYYRER